MSDQKIHHLYPERLMEQYEPTPLEAANVAAQNLLSSLAALECMDPALLARVGWEVPGKYGYPGITTLLHEMEKAETRVNKLRRRIQVGAIGERHMPRFHAVEVNDQA